MKSKKNQIILRENNLYANDKINRTKKKRGSRKKKNSKKYRREKKDINSITYMKKKNNNNNNNNNNNKNKKKEKLSPAKQVQFLPYNVFETVHRFFNTKNSSSNLHPFPKEKKEEKKEEKKNTNLNTNPFENFFYNFVKKQNNNQNQTEKKDEKKNHLNPSEKMESSKSSSNSKKSNSPKKSELKDMEKQIAHKIAPSDIAFPKTERKEESMDFIEPEEEIEKEKIRFLSKKIHMMGTKKQIARNNATSNDGSKIVIVPPKAEGKEKNADIELPNNDNDKDKDNKNIGKVFSKVENEKKTDIELPNNNKDKEKDNKNIDKDDGSKTVIVPPPKAERKKENTDSFSVNLFDMETTEDNYRPFVHNSPSFRGIDMNFPLSTALELLKQGEADEKKNASKDTPVKTPIIQPQPLSINKENKPAIDAQKRQSFDKKTPTITSLHVKGEHVKEKLKKNENTIASRLNNYNNEGQIEANSIVYYQSSHIFYLVILFYFQETYKEIEICFKVISCKDLGSETYLISLVFYNFCTTNDLDNMVTETYKFIAEAIKKNKKKIFFPVNLQFPTFAHVNLLVYHVNKQSLEWYEPHGCSICNNNVEAMNNNINYFLDTLEKKMNDELKPSKIKTYKSFQVCPRKGVQLFEHFSKKKPENSVGRCTLWMFFFIEQLSKSNVTAKSFMKRIVNSPPKNEDIKDFFFNVSSGLLKKIEKYFNKSFKNNFNITLDEVMKHENDFVNYWNKPSEPKNLSEDQIKFIDLLKHKLFYLNGDRGIKSDDVILFNNSHVSSYNPEEEDTISETKVNGEKYKVLVIYPTETENKQLCNVFFDNVTKLYLKDFLKVSDAEVTIFEEPDYFLLDSKKKRNNIFDSNPNQKNIAEIIRTNRYSYIFIFNMDFFIIDYYKIQQILTQNGKLILSQQPCYKEYDETNFQPKSNPFDDNLNHNIHYNFKFNTEKMFFEKNEIKRFN
jgi:hypothetical protein